MQKRLDIAIVGAGVAGLAAGIALARAGHRVVAYERVPQSRPVGSGLMLQPTGLAALQRLGLRTTIEAMGHRIGRLKGATRTGRTIFDVAYGDLDPGLYAVGVHRGLLHRTLWDAFALSGASLEPSRAITALEPRADGRLSPSTSDGRVGAPADLVIDASGARSELRRRITDRPARAFAYGAVWATVPDIGLSPTCLAQRYDGARVMAGYLPVGRISDSGPALAALFWSLKPDGHAEWQQRFDAWRDDLAALWPEFVPALATVGDPSHWTLASYAHFTAPRLSHRNFVLIGDSAHATSPQLGQGANNGMIDAVVLADAIERERDLDAALATYARHRRRHMRFYQLASALMTPLFQSDSRVLPAVRDAAFPALRVVPYLRREMVRTLAGLKTGLLSSARPEDLVHVEGAPALPEPLIEAA